MTGRKRIGIILILGSLAALGPFTIDMYLPGFARIARDLHTSVAAVGYSLTSYFIGISLGQLIYGPLTDRFGRKKPLVSGLLLYVAASVACSFAPSIAWLIAARLVAALGACVGMVASRAVVRDLFPVPEIAGIFSTFILIIALSPMIAPTVGATLTATLGWQVIFLILAALATLLTVVIVLLLPESRDPNPEVSLRPGQILAGYLSVGANSQFLTFALLMGFASAGLFAFVSGVSFMFLELFGLQQSQFGLAFAVNTGGLIAGSQVNRLLLRRYDSRSIARVAVSAQLLLGTALLLVVAAGLTSFALVIALLASFLFCIGLVNPNAQALALEPFDTHAGAASALMGSIQMAMGALASVLVSAFTKNSVLPMVSVIWSSAAAGFLLLHHLRRRELHASSMRSTP